MKNGKKIIMSLILASSMVIFNTLGFTASSENDNLSISQMEDLKKANQQQIEELQKQIDTAKQQLEQSENNTKAKEEYQQALYEKINLQQENIAYIEDQITSINSQIDTLNSNIEYLENQMETLQLDIDTNMEQFKKRLRAMYISGNDSLASVLVGATDFFDILTKMEFIARISSHDNALMETLKAQIKDYNEDEEILLLTKQELEEKKSQSTEKREEFNDILTQLSADYQNTQEELDKLSEEQNQLNNNIENLEQYEREQQEEEKKIQQAIKNYYIQSSIALSSSISESESVSKSVEQSISESISQSQSESISNSIKDSIAESESRYISESESRYVSESESVSISIRESQQATTTQTITVTASPVTVATEPTTTYNSYLTSGTFNWPVPNFYTITDYYDIRTWNNQGMHYGIDISGINVAGADIVSAESGTVILVSNSCTHNYPKWASCGCGGGFGNYVIIDHGGGYATLYGHCQNIDVIQGQYVERGQVIAHVGTTGYSTGYHLHFEVRYNGERIDPLPFLT